MDELQKKVIAKTKAEAKVVKELGETIGYGNLMELASALWRKSLKEQGIPESGAFVPTVSMMLKDEYKEGTKKSCDLYDSIVKDI